jgi:Arylsulfotransferase (ASST)
MKRKTRGGVRSRAAQQGGGVLFAALVAVCCAGPGCDDEQTDAPLLGEARFIINPDNQFSALVTVVLEQGAEVVVEYGAEDAFDRTTPSTTVAAGVETELLVLGLVAGVGHGMRVVATSGEQRWTSPSVTVTTPPLPSGWPACTVVSPVDPADFGEAEVVCTDGLLDQGTPIYYCVDRQGSPRYELRHPDGEQIRHVQVLSDGNLMAAGYSDEFVAIFDPAGRLLVEYDHFSFLGLTRFLHQWLDQHDAIEIIEGPWKGAIAFMTVALESVEGEDQAGNGVLVVQPYSGEVLWDWSIHGELGDGVPIDPSLPYDRYGLLHHSGVEWLHANTLLHGVDEAGDQFFWMSLRAQDWIIKVDVETDAIEWRLGFEGDFDLVDDLDAASPTPLGPNKWMFQQHAPEWTARDGSRTRFLVFDNGNARPLPLPDGAERYSRVVEFEIDEDTRRAAITFDHGSPDPLHPDHFASEAYGDADLLPGGETLLFDAGLHNPERSAFLAEISYPGGVERWRYDCPDGPSLFLLEFFPSLYEMTWRY